MVSVRRSLEGEGRRMKGEGRVAVEEEGECEKRREEM